MKIFRIFAICIVLFSAVFTSSCDGLYGLFKSNTWVDVNIFTNVLKKFIEKAITQYGYEASVFSYFLLPLGIDAENGSLYTEIKAF
jgi:hypothetical protein